MFIKPANNLKVRNPRTMLHIADAGEEVEDSSFWQRRLDAGDVVLAEPGAPSKKSTTVTTSTVDAEDDSTQTNAARKRGNNRKE